MSKKVFSGHTKAPETKAHTVGVKYKDPVSKSIGGEMTPPAKTTDIPELTSTEKQKESGEKSPNFKTNVLGVELTVNGRSHADINSLLVVGFIRKHLEGRGQFIKKITIELEDPTEKTLKESKLRSAIRSIIKDVLSEND